MSTLYAATDLARAIERVCDGFETAAVDYALGMVLAHGVAMQKNPDLDGTMRLYRRIVEVELLRQFPTSPAAVALSETKANEAGGPG